MRGSGITCENCKVLRRTIRELEQELQLAKLTISGHQAMLAAIRVALNHADLKHEPELSAIRDELNTTLGGKS